jgi:tetratricopeptide (TPR) repeat protein
MVYGGGMMWMLVALLLAAAPADGHTGEEPAAIPAQAAPEPAADAGEARLPEATAPGVPAQAPAPRPELRILQQDSRFEAYQQFRALYDSARFEEALPYARRVVELSEQDPARDHELPIAYNNLGATQYQLHDYAGAAASYRQSLELLESTQGISSRRLVVPLAGLGAVYAAQDEHQVAAELYDRAIAVSRRAEGLFNLQQLPLLKQAADSRYAIDDFPGAEREYMYAVKIAEQNYGYGDPRTIPPLLELGAFYEGLRQFIPARMMYLRARDAALKASPGYSPEAVKSLTGIARTYRMQYAMDPDSLDGQQPARDDVMGEMFGKPPLEPRAPPAAGDRAGLKAAQTALEMLSGAPNPPPDLMAQTLIELGDWYQSTSRPALSMPYYSKAAGILDAQVAADPLAGHPLRAPRMVVYRPPASASRRLSTPPGQFVVRKTVFSLAVTDVGEPQDITIVSTDMNEDQVGLTRRALAKAIYSPRFAEGQPVATAGVTFTSEWYEEFVPAPDSPPARPASAPPADDEPVSSPAT